MFPEGIRRERGEVENMNNHTVTFIETDPEEMSQNRGEDTIAWLCRWHYRDQ